MALTDSFPGPSGLTDSVEAGKDLAALVAHSGGVPKAGVTWQAAASLLVARSDLRVDVGAFKAVLVRDGAVRLLANDATAQSPDITVPTTNSRIDVLYVKVGEVSAGDAVDGPFFGIVQGTAAASPSKPTLNIAGALELGTITIPSTATATNSSGVVIATTVPTTAAVGVVSQTTGAFSFGSLYKAHTSWAPPVLEKIGNRVHFHGTITNVGSISFLASTPYSLGTIPVDFRPKAGGQVIGAAASSSPAATSAGWVAVYTGGNVELSLTNGFSAAANVWLLGFDLWWDVA